MAKTSVTGIDIGAKAKELASKLREEGFGGFDCPDCRLCADSSKNYACISDAGLDSYIDVHYGEYIDWPMLEYDFAQMLQKHFESAGEYVALVRQHESKRDNELPQSGSVIVVRVHGRNQVEIYRMVDGVVLCNQEEE